LVKAYLKRKSSIKRRNSGSRSVDREPFVTRGVGGLRVGHPLAAGKRGKKRAAGGDLGEV